jgi:hypothetical protein
MAIDQSFGFAIFCPFGPASSANATSVGHAVDAVVDRRDQRQRRRLLLRMKSGLEFVECHPDHAPRCLDFKDSRKSFSEMRARLFLDASYY